VGTSCTAWTARTAAAKAAGTVSARNIAVGLDDSYAASATADAEATGETNEEKV